VLTCETLAQARDRASAPAKNKGGEAARSAVETANLLSSLRPSRGGAGRKSGRQPGRAPARPAVRGAAPRGAAPRGANR
jgi:hypothetical protein